MGLGPSLEDSGNDPNVSEGGRTPNAGTRDTNMKDEREGEQYPTRFTRTATLSPEGPAYDLHGIVEGFVEQISNLPGSEVSITLKVDVEVRSGFDRANVRPLI